MSCSSCPPTTTCCSQVQDICAFPSDAQCIQYSGAALSCIGIATNTYLDVILQAINDQFCALEDNLGVTVQDEGVTLGIATTLNFVGDSVTVTMLGADATITVENIGEGTVTSVDVDGATTGMVFTGGPITTSGTITMSGTLDVDNGGTGQTTYEDGELLIGNSSGNTLSKATLTAGTGISIINGNGSITIDATSSATVSSFSFTNINGFTGVVTNPTTTPTLQISTSLTNQQVVYASTGGAINGIDEFTWDDSTNSLTIGANTSSSNGTIIIGGASTGTGTIESGSLVVSTASVERLNIDGDGAWLLASDAGTAGQVFTSNGIGAPPTWEDAASTTITADNGLIMSTSTNVQLGGPVGSPSILLNDRYIDGDVFRLFISGDVAEGNSVGILDVQASSSANATAISGTGIGSSAGIKGSSTTGTGVEGTTTDGVGVHGSSAHGVGVNGLSFVDGVGVQAASIEGVALVADIEPASTNTVAINTVLRRVTQGTAANGIGESLDFSIETAVENEAVSNQIISKWTDATHATRTSEFSITGVDSATTNTLLTLGGDGAARLNEYGAGTFTGSETFLLGVDASGNIIETSSSSSPAFQVLTDAATVVWDINNGAVAEVTLGGNRTLDVDNPAIGTASLKVIQDGPGNRTLTLPANSKVQNGLGSGTSITLSTTGGNEDWISYMYDGTNFYWTSGLNFQ